MSKFCRSCGHALEEGATACPACGKSTSREVAPAKKNNNDVLNKISEVILVIFCLIERLLLLLVAKIGEAVKNAKASDATKDAKINLGVVSSVADSKDAADDAKGVVEVATTFVATATDKGGKVIAEYTISNN